MHRKASKHHASAFLQRNKASQVACPSDDDYRGSVEERTLFSAAHVGSQWEHGSPTVGVGERE